MLDTGGEGVTEPGVASISVRSEAFGGEVRRDDVGLLQRWSLKHRSVHVRMFISIINGPIIALGYITVSAIVSLRCPSWPLFVRSDTRGQQPRRRLYLHYFTATHTHLSPSTRQPASQDRAGHTKPQIHPGTSFLFNPHPYIARPAHTFFSNKARCARSDYAVTAASISCFSFFRSSETGSLESAMSPSAIHLKVVLGYLTLAAAASSANQKTRPGLWEWR